MLIDDEQVYSRVTVRINNNGVLLRDTEKGINIGTKKQYLAKAGQFIVSKLMRETEPLELFQMNWKGQL
ncbi:MAG: hypothetical protein IPJ79_07080 [Bacteroidetes bacterium]|nr:hypothetical protein [Bacteroidota bacterium]